MNYCMVNTMLKPTKKDLVNIFTLHLELINLWLGGIFWWTVLKNYSFQSLCQANLIKNN